jgi:hypothetical protein
MKRILIAIVVTASLAIWTQAESADSSRCLYPAKPINWILKYCSLIAETDDEIAIQGTQCFKRAQSDLKSKDECAVKTKYKTKACTLLLSKKYTDHKSVADCLKDKDVEPFVAGD